MNTKINQDPKPSDGVEVSVRLLIDILVQADETQVYNVRIDFWTTIYKTMGGTWIVASNPAGNDDDAYHDLVALLADRTILTLRPTANPIWVDALEAEWGKRRA